ncbi:hypothetical protein [uncultured Flavobacterium sp.]|uniref:hypothetical protein n=1 Tax=uncultured Flavobacterium sp. TaxID=165435 RepID=UPI0025D2F5CD|nr:hypothetical protein [uncultured Flavobacterium sp.]
MKKIFFNAIMPLILLATLLTSCANEDLTPLYGEQAPGKVVLRGYSALADSVQVRAGGKLLEINDADTFKGEISADYEFVYYSGGEELIEILDKASGSVLQSYTFTDEEPIDTVSFYASNGIWINDVLAQPPGVLSGTGRTGYRFIFPTMNRYSNSGYNGPVDAIIKKVNGQVLGVAEDITKENFSTYVEFDFAPPPILNIELVKHGTTESYIAGQPVIVQAVMQNNRSRLIVLDEKADTNGTFSGVSAIINLVDHFDF